MVDSISICFSSFEQEFASSLSLATKESELCEALRLEDLPDEVLIHVAKWLPRVSDIVQLSRLSQRFVPFGRDELLFHHFLLTKWALHPASAEERKAPDQTWKELTLDCESLIGSWHGHASQVRAKLFPGIRYIELSFSPLFMATLG